MCGIAGFVDIQLSAEDKQALTRKMLKVISYRGPEASNVFTNGPVSLGHNRLKIIDLSDVANQPMHYGDITIIFNGEVYNYVEVRALLEQQGYRFRTHSDTEVICAAYKCYGDDCVKHFVGMWSLAIWDTTRQRLFCSRDRFGIKPFYYLQRGQNLYFASEYKALKELPFFDRQLNTEQLSRGLQMVWSSYRQETYYTHLKQLQPAHNLTWQNGNIALQRYWDIDAHAPASRLSPHEKKEMFFTLFKDSVRLHARSDVPNGTCLSGGLDSSAISSMYSTLMPDAPIKSFSIFYEDDVDERPFVREVVNKYPTIQPFYFSPDNRQITDSFHNIAYHADVPLLGSSFISQYFLMRLAKSEGVTVAIDGQGSDEYLGGYLHTFYRLLGQLGAKGKFARALQILNNLADREKFSSKKKRDFMLKSLVSVFSNENRMYNLEYAQFSKYTEDGIEDLHFEDKLPGKFDNFLYHILMNTTLQTLLHFEDRNSMAFSIESRVPFLDHRLVEFAFTLQREDRINDKAETKYILREALKPILPAAVYQRKDKKGFVTPGEVKWLNGPLKFLLDIDYKRLHWLKKDRVKAVVENYKRGDTSKAALVWRLACTHYWLKNFN